MNPTRKGQTALEYLLIVVVAIIIVVAVMVWMQSTTSTTTNTASGTANVLNCELTACATDADCTAAAPCAGLNVVCDTAAGTCDVQ